MSLTDDDALTYARCCEVLRGFPKTGAALGEVAATIRDQCPSIEHANALIEILHRADEWPGIGRFTILAQSIAALPQPSPPPPPEPPAASPPEAPKLPPGLPKNYTTAQLLAALDRQDRRELDRFERLPRYRRDAIERDMHRFYQPYAQRISVPVADFLELGKPGLTNRETYIISLMRRHREHGEPLPGQPPARKRKRKRCR